MGDTLAFFFTNHEDSIPFAVDGQITSHADGFQQADLVFGDGILAGSLHFTEYRKVEVHKLYGHNRVVHQILVNQAFLNHLGNVAFGHACDMECSQHGKVNIPVIVQRISGNLSVIVSTFQIGISCTVLNFREVEQRSQLRIFTGYHNGNLVFGLHGDISSTLDYFRLVNHNVLKVKNFLRGVTRREQHNPEKKSQKSLFHFYFTVQFIFISL